MEKLSDSVSMITEGKNQIFIIENSHATSKISLFGAQVLSYAPKSDSKDRLWLSQQTKTDSSEVIRGGVPLCWPWFGNQFPSDSDEEELSAHGFLRNNFWHQTNIEEPDSGVTRIIFTFDVSPRAGFRHQAQVILTVEVSQQLTLSLAFKNTGTTEFEITGALHTYFRITDIAETQLRGLTGFYKDKTRGFAKFTTPSPYCFTTETDNVHLDDTPDLSINEKNNAINISAQGHDSHVVWNPGPETVKSIGNIANEDYRQFLCVEAAITTGLAISPGKSHTLQQIIY